MHLPDLTCASCVHIGRIYHDNGLQPDYWCGKTNERRAEEMKPSGDYTEDFMRNWRAFFDARPDQRACRHYRARPIASDETIRVRRVFERTPAYSARRATFKFLSVECTACERMDNLFVKQDWHSDYGHKTFALTKLGEAELARAQKASQHAATPREVGKDD